MTILTCMIHTGHFYEMSHISSTVETTLDLVVRLASKVFSRSNWTAAMHKDEMDQYICVNQFWKPPVSRSSSGFLCRVTLRHILSDWTKWLHIPQQNFLYHYLSVCWKIYLCFGLFLLCLNLTVIYLPEFLKYFLPIFLNILKAESLMYYGWSDNLEESQ